MDGLPLFSQLKSLVQVISGDAEGARRTQENFTYRCPIISQTRSAVEAISGDEEAARKTQMEFVDGVSDFADGVPVVGHLKGTVHYIVGDTDGGDQAMKSASRSSAAIAGGIAGGIVGGPVGAFAGGVAGATAMDGITTGVEYALHNEYRPSGVIEQVGDVVDNPSDPGKWFDLVATPVSDGMAGMAGFDLKAKKVPNAKKSKAMDKKIGKEGTKDVVKSADSVRNQLKKGELPADKSSTQTMVRDQTTGDIHYGENRLSRRNKHVESRPEGTSIKQAEKTFVKSEIIAPESALQRQRPDLCQTDAYPQRGCAEHPAYDGYYGGREGALPSESTASTVRYLPNGKEIVAQKRCDKCLTYSDAMGNVPTDLVHDMIVPDKYVSQGQLASSTGATAALAAVSATAYYEPSSVNEITVDDISETSATVNWSDAQWDKIHYLITVTPSAGVTVDPSHVLGITKQRKSMLSGLKPDCTYEVSIVTRNGDRKSLTKAVKFTTSRSTGT